MVGSARDGNQSHEGWNQVLGCACNSRDWVQQLANQGIYSEDISTHDGINHHKYLARVPLVVSFHNEEDRFGSNCCPNSGRAPERSCFGF